MGDQQLKVADLETPAVLIDLDALDRNLRHTQELANKAGVKLRPHFKTHKSAWIAKEQIRHGAVGMTCAKLGEAEVLVDAGITDILIAYPLYGEAKMARLAKLLERARIIVGIDNMDVAKGLSDLGVSLNRRIELYVDVDTGLGRCGQPPGAATAELVKQISALPGVEVIGLMTHGGFSYKETTPEGQRKAAKQEAEGLVMTKRLLAEEGIDIKEISVGSTPTSEYITEQEGVTEMRPGAYVYGDVSALNLGLKQPEHVAMHVLATVVSTPRPGTVIVDAGSKTFTSDANRMYPGFGILKSDRHSVNREVYVERLSEEHGNVRVPEGVQFKVGDRLLFVPNHCCTVSNLHDELIGVRGDKVERIITVDARGKIR